jgi:hypothetical protein
MNFNENLSGVNTFFAIFPTQGVFVQLLHSHLPANHGSLKRVSVYCDCNLLKLNVDELVANNLFQPLSGTDFVVASMKSALRPGGTE